MDYQVPKNAEYLKDMFFNIHVTHVSPFLLKVAKTRQTSNSRCPTAKCNFNKYRRGDFQQPFGRFLPIVLVPDVG